MQDVNGPPWPDQQERWVISTRLVSAWPTSLRGCDDQRADGSAATGGDSGFEAVAHAAHGPQPPRLVGVGLDLLAQSSHVLGHRRRVLPVRRGVPHVLQDLL